MDAVRRGDAAIAGALLEGGANANAANPEGETVLMAAARSGSVAEKMGANMDSFGSSTGRVAL